MCISPKFFRFSKRIFVFDISNSFVIFFDYFTDSWKRVLVFNQEQYDAAVIKARSRGSKRLRPMSPPHLPLKKPFLPPTQEEIVTDLSKPLPVLDKPVVLFSNILDDKRDDLKKVITIFIYYIHCNL